MDILVLDKTSLTANLSTDGVMGKTSGREEWDLLSTSDGVHDIDGGDTSLDHLLWVISLIWINRLSLDIEEVFSEDGRTMIDGNTLTIELATKHLGGDGHAEHVASELTVRVGVVDVGGTFENLDDGALASDFEDLSLPGLSVSELDVDDLSVSIDKGNQRVRQGSDRRRGEALTWGT